MLSKDTKKETHQEDSAPLHLYLALICTSTTIRMISLPIQNLNMLAVTVRGWLSWKHLLGTIAVKLHIKVKDGYRSTLHWTAAPCFSPFKHPYCPKKNLMLTVNRLDHFTYADYSKSCYAYRSCCPLLGNVYGCLIHVTGYHHD